MHHPLGAPRLGGAWDCFSLGGRAQLATHFRNIQSSYARHRMLCDASALGSYCFDWVRNALQILSRENKYVLAIPYFPNHETLTPKLLAALK